ncbi:MAG: hypothetical protein K2Q32_01870, partial [Alphaproteobacteria bacterium]|nr:hypothetical protein [Alphaproteobacteria bacterium]
LGVLGYAHNQGAGGAAQWLATGHAGRDGFGTSGKKYFDAILDGLKKVGDFIVGGLKFIWDHTIGALFNSGQKPPEQQPPHLHPQPGLQKPNHGKWQFNMAPEQTYAPFQPPVRPGFTPERGTLPTNGWVNNQPLNGQALGNPVQSNVVMGDSIGVSMKSQYQGVKNVAVGGWSIQRAIKQFERVPQGSVADVYLGSNNGPCTPEQNRQQTLAFLRAADAHGVRINNWILPGEYPGHPKADAQLKVVADVIRQTVQEYNMTHKQDQRITPIETRGKGIELYPRDLHLTTTGNQQLKAQIASQHNAARHATYASAEPRPQPIPLNEWRMKNPEPKKSA